jgi:hypothetical protein
MTSLAEIPPSGASKGLHERAASFCPYEALADAERDGVGSKSYPHGSRHDHLVILDILKTPGPASSPTEHFLKPESRRKKMLASDVQVRVLAMKTVLVVEEATRFCHVSLRSGPRAGFISIMCSGLAAIYRTVPH